MTAPNPRLTDEERSETLMDAQGIVDDYGPEFGETPWNMARLILEQRETIRELRERADSAERSIVLMLEQHYNGSVDCDNCDAGREYLLANGYTMRHDKNRPGKVTFARALAGEPQEASDAH